AVALCTDNDAAAGLDLTFLERPPLVSPRIPQDGFNVPLDGLSWGGAMYVFFSTDHYSVQGRDLMGASVLTRSDNDGLDYRLLHEVSRFKFINVSSSIVDGEAQGLPGRGPWIALFGSGRYRSSDVYFAAKPAGDIEQPGGWRFYAGGREQP